MSNDEKLNKLKEEIAEVEKLMEQDHFGGIVDRSRADKNYSRLKKLKKELKELEKGRK